MIKIDRHDKKVSARKIESFTKSTRKIPVESVSKYFFSYECQGMLKLRHMSMHIFKL